MFAPKVAKAQTCAPTDLTNSFARPRSTPSARGYSPVGQSLPREIRNQAMSRSPTQRAARSTEDGFDRDSEQGSLPLAGTVQPKIVVGKVDDPLEHEADRIADQVARGVAPSAVSGSLPHIQRASAMKGGDDLRPAPASADSVLAATGRPLDAPEQKYFGQLFGRDFSHVRVHTGPAAARSAHDLSARAYTTGNAIVFGEGQFSPQTATGRRLLAHELTHTIQQQGGGLQRQLIQRDLAIAPGVASPAAVTLTKAQMRGAVRSNSVLFADAAEIAVLRDVLGIAKQPSVIDEDFVNALVRYQAAAGLTPDGELGASAAASLEREITAEADSLAQPPTGTPLRRVARRLHLRAMISRRTGTVTHQGFIGPDDNPTGAVTVRAGDREGGATNAISLEHTGENSDATDWLQFINMRMFATPVGRARVFSAGAVGTTGGPVNWSNAATTNWFVDAVPGGSPLYNVSGGLNTRAAARRLAMFDEPGGAAALPVAQAFTAAGATSVTMRMGFDSYVVRNNRARYHVDWSATTTYNITAAIASAIVYAQGAAGVVAGLRAEHRAALLAEYPGNPIV